MKREVKLHLLLTSFIQEVQVAIFASDSDSHRHMSLTQQNVQTYKQFAAEIAATKPAYAESPSKYWNHVDDITRRCTTWELPGNTPYLALKSLISEYTARWKSPSQRCFNSVAEKLVSYIEAGIIQNHFKEFPVLRDHVLKITQTSIHDIMSSAGRRLNSVLELEQRAPFYTLIQDDYVSAVATWKSNLDDLSGYNHQHTLQVELMAKALAYYGISSKRFTDYVMLTLESELKQDFSNGLHAILLESVSSTNSAPQIEELMAEDPALDRRRVSLKERRDALEGILARLLEYDPDLIAASEVSPRFVPLSIPEDPPLEKLPESTKAKEGSPSRLFSPFLSQNAPFALATRPLSQLIPPTLMQPRAPGIISSPMSLPTANEPVKAVEEESSFAPVAKKMTKKEREKMKKDEEKRKKDERAAVKKLEDEAKAAEEVAVYALAEEEGAKPMTDEEVGALAVQEEGKKAEEDDFGWGGGWGGGWGAVKVKRKGTKLNNNNEFQED
ncbi:hypothetical protein DL96DRAFT_1826060 [Flagelloscypha sp. PMI_526]|nr:hypothetical protein DL96DRAFT_1826060 [Flagelloscypha sp. PMI_526]